jgi:hypothetical protein
MDAVTFPLMWSFTADFGILLNLYVLIVFVVYFSLSYNFCHCDTLVMVSNQSGVLAYVLVLSIFVGLNRSDVSCFRHHLLVTILC